MCAGRNAGASSAAPDCQAAGISEADLPQPERTGGKSGCAVADDSAV